jgi:hypothetical protein
MREDRARLVVGAFQFAGSGAPMRNAATNRKGIVVESRRLCGT